MKKKFFLSSWIFVLGIWLLAFLVNGFALEVKAQVETQSFFVDNSYDLFGRKQIEAVLIRSDRSLYFYVEKPWWESRSPQEQNDLRIAMAELGLEFQNRIYPVLTSTFGSEPKPGIDRDERITVLVHQMADETGGYFRLSDVYERLISPTSNEREMLYLNSRHIASPQAKSYLAHEFTHIITINQKDLLRRVPEEVWLNEARAEYASTLLGYDDSYQGSNLERRVREFLENPSTSLIEWRNLAEDYGAVNLLAQYLVDHYGVQILVDSLRSSQVGIASLNEALRKNGFEKDFHQIFTDWVTTMLVNDCTVGERYCYGNANLANLRVIPTLYIIPRSETIFSTYHTVASWSANWHRLIGGQGNLTLEFMGDADALFTVPYVLCGTQEICSVGFLSLDDKQGGTLVLSEFDKKYSSVTILPFAQGNTVEGNGDSFVFSWKVTVQGAGAAQEQEETTLRKLLLVRIAELQEQVRRLQIRIAALQGQSGPPTGVASCARLERNLSFGSRSAEVRCLQEFLAAQGQSVYPEALVTGNFLSLTRQAVIRFQEKYASEILAPLGLTSGTGYVGKLTRNKINALLEFSTALAI